MPNFGSSEWRRAVSLCEMGRMLPAAIAHLAVGHRASGEDEHDELDQIQAQRRDDPRP
jgi:hypothetical protein